MANWSSAPAWLPEQPKQADRRAWARQVNRLIVACKDDAFVHNAAIAVVKSPPGRARLAERSRRRDLFIRDLGDLVHSLGGTAANHGSLLVNVRGALHRLRAAVIGGNDGDEYGACSRVETKTEEAYANTLETSLPEAVRSIVEKQHDEIERDRDELRRQQFSREKEGGRSFSGPA